MNEIELRDHFAMNAPDTVISIPDWTAEQCLETLGLPEDTEYNWRIHWVLLIAKLAYQYADAMLEARKQGVPPTESKKDWKKFGEASTKTCYSAADMSSASTNGFRAGYAEALKPRWEG